MFGIKGEPVWVRTTPQDWHLSFVACGNAAGEMLVPSFIFPGKRAFNNYMAGRPEARIMMTDSGYQEESSWNIWAQDFVQQTGGKCILIADNHSTRQSLGTLQTFIDADVTVVTLYPHTTHVAQPCDVCFFRGFKNKIDAVMTDLAVKGETVNKLTIVAAVKKAWDGVVTPASDPTKRGVSSAMVAGFKATGIHPPDRSKLLNPAVTKLADEIAAERATRAATLAAAEAQMGEDDGDEEEKEMDDKDDDGDEDCEEEVEADDDDAPLTEEERLKKAAKCLVLPPDTLANLRKFVGRRVPQTSVVLTGADSIKGLLEKEEKAEEVAADKQRKKLQRQVKKEVDGILSKPPSTWVATAFPRRRGPTPLVPASTVNQWDTDRGKGVKVRLLYVDTENGGSAGSVRSTYNASFRRAWKRLRDEASNDDVVVLPPAAATTEVPDDDDEL